MVIKDGGGGGLVPLIKVRYMGYSGIFKVLTIILQNKIFQITSINFNITSFEKLFFGNTSYTYFNLSKNIFSSTG